MSVPLTTAAECLALVAAAPPTTAVEALRLRTTPGKDAVVPLPTGNLAGCSRWFAILFFINASFAAVAAFFSPG